jgi:Lon protease-like protein
MTETLLTDQQVAARMAITVRTFRRRCQANPVFCKDASILVQHKGREARRWRKAAVLEWEQADPLVLGLARILGCRPTKDAVLSAARALKERKEEVIVTTEAALREALREAIGGVNRP